MNLTANRRVFLTSSLSLAAAPEMAASAISKIPAYIPAVSGLLKFGDSDLQCGIHVMSLASEQEIYFESNLSQHGITPIWLQISNMSTVDTFLIVSDDITVANGNTTLSQAERTKTSVSTKSASIATTAGVVLLTPALAISLPLLIFGGISLKKAGEVKRNLVERQFYSRSLGPGASVGGFVYVQESKASGLGPGFVLSLIAQPIPIAPENLPRKYTVDL